MELRQRGERLLRHAIRAVLGRARVSRPPSVPRLVNWDLTYACPLRCEHCYSESGRRPSRQLSQDDLLRIADVLVGLSPVPEIVFTGGEPLLVKGVVELAERLRAGGARLALYTSGYNLRPALTSDLVRLFQRIAVSIDGDTPEISDTIRGRVGAFGVAVSALEQLGAAAGGRSMRLGIECTVVRSNLDHLEGLARDLPRRLPKIDFVHFGAAIPTGLASEEAYAARELLDEASMAKFRRLAPTLRALAPRGVRVVVYDNDAFRMTTDLVRRARANDDLVKIEADGRMRGMDIYEGTVGNVLDEPFEALWSRACATHHDPFVEQQLRATHTMKEWARATRAIDEHFAAPEDLIRIRKRRDPTVHPRG